MTKRCEITGKLPLAGNTVSHAHNKGRRRFLPNLHSHKFWHPGRKRFVRLKLSAKGIRIIDKYGIEAVMEYLESGKKMRKQGAVSATSEEQNTSPVQPEVQ